MWISRERWYISFVWLRNHFKDLLSVPQTEHYPSTWPGEADDKNDALSSPIPGQSANIETGEVASLAT